MNTVLEKLIKKTLDNKLPWKKEEIVGGYSFDFYISESTYHVRLYFDKCGKKYGVSVDTYNVCFLTEDEYKNLVTIIDNSIIKRNEEYYAQKVKRFTSVLDRL